MKSKRISWKNKLDWLRINAPTTVKQFNNHFHTNIKVRNFREMCRYYNIPTKRTRILWTQDKLDWLEANAGIKRIDLLAKFNKHFNTNVKMSALKSAIREHRLYVPSTRIKWTQDKLNWLSEQTYDDLNILLDEFNKKYNAQIKKSQLSHIGFIYKIKLPASKAVYAPAGTIMHSHHNIPQIKISDRIYAVKHRHIYETYHNVKLTSEDIILFLDGDKTNFNIENLYKINYKIHAHMCNSGFYKLNRLPIIKTLEWKYKLKELEKEN